MLAKVICKIPLISTIYTVSVFAAMQGGLNLVGVSECAQGLQSRAQVYDAHDWNFNRYQRLLKQHSLTTTRSLLDHLKRLLSGSLPLSAEDEDLLAMALAYEEGPSVCTEILQGMRDQTRNLSPKQIEILTSISHNPRLHFGVRFKADEVLATPPKEINFKMIAMQRSLDYPSINFRGTDDATLRYLTLKQLDEGPGKPSPEELLAIRRIARYDLDAMVRAMAGHILAKHNVPSLTLVK